MSTRDTQVSKFLLPVVAWYASLDSVSQKKNRRGLRYCIKSIQYGHLYSTPHLMPSVFASERFSLLSPFVLDV